MRIRYNYSICLIALLFLFVPIFIEGCTSNIPTGQWESDLEVKNNFETGSSVPNHTYYYWGSYNAPDAIIAIDNHYTLHEGNVWAKVERVDVDDSLKNWFRLYKTKEKGRLFIVEGSFLSLTGDRQEYGIHYAQTILYRCPPEGNLLYFSLQNNPPGRFGVG